jgi:hypothetical protein
MGKINLVRSVFEIAQIQRLTRQSDRKHRCIRYAESHDSIRIVWSFSMKAFAKSLAQRQLVQALGQ